MATSSAAISYGVETESARKGVVALLGRVLFSLIFVLAGLNHFSKPTIAYAASQGVPLASIALPLSGVIAILGGLSILLSEERLKAQGMFLELLFSHRRAELITSGLVEQEQQLPVNCRQYGKLEWELKALECGGQGRNRTADASLFRAALYRLSYLATPGGVRCPIIATASLLGERAQIAVRMRIELHHFRLGYAARQIRDLRCYDSVSAIQHIAG